MPGHLRHCAVRRKAALVNQPPPYGENLYLPDAPGLLCRCATDLRALSGHVVPRPGPARSSIRTGPVRGTQSLIEPAQFVQVGLDLQGLGGAQLEIGFEMRLRLGIPL